jgi:hypothetical protein
MGEAGGVDGRPPVRFSGTGAIDPYLAREFAKVVGFADAVHTDRASARVAGHRDVVRRAVSCSSRHERARASLHARRPGCPRASTPW